MTSELNSSHYIEDFISGRPKNVAYTKVYPVTGSGKTVCKVREIILNYSVSKVVNFDTIKDMILKGDETEKSYSAHIEGKISETGWIGK